MQIDYELKHADEHGQGIFTKQDIPKGTVIYFEDKGDNKYIKNLQELKDLFKDKDQEFIKLFIRYSYGLNGMICWVIDDSKYMNHSENRNLGFQQKDKRNLVALRDIKKGEQLLEDYRSFQRLEWAEEYYHQFGIDDFLESLNYETFNEQL